MNYKSIAEEAARIVFNNNKFQHRDKAFEIAVSLNDAAFKAIKDVDTLNRKYLAEEALKAARTESLKFMDNR